MPPDLAQPTIAADDAGIHFLHGKRDTVVVWGEIEQVCALRETDVNGTAFIEVYVDHFSGVDFVFHSTEVGYHQATAEMEKHLIGFKREALEAVRTFEEEGESIPTVWKRDEEIQQFQIAPPVIDPREPTAEERVQMQAAHQASIGTCEKAPGRSLTVDELACMQTKFENGSIGGSITAPLCQLLVEQQR